MGEILDYERYPLLMWFQRRIEAARQSEMDVMEEMLYGRDTAAATGIPRCETMGPTQEAEKA